MDFHFSSALLMCLEAAIVSSPGILAVIPRARAILSLSPRRVCRNQTDEGRDSRVPKLWNAGLLAIVDRRWVEIECFHLLGGPES